MANKKEVIITCNATNVKAVIEGLERGMAALAKEEEHLLGVIKQRGYAENDEKKRLKELEKAMDAMRTNIQKNREETKKFNQVMRDLSGATLKDLKKALQEGKNALNKMSERDPRRAKLVDDLKRIQHQIEKNTGAIKAQGNAFATTAKNLATYMIGFAGFNKLKSLIEGVFQANIKLSDSLANIRKVSGLSGEAINELYRNIAKIDSRNTIETLNNLAYTGAKLGIGQNYGVAGLTGFVKAAEQVQMALGEDMGEKALPELSKMIEVMGLIPKYGVEQAMQKAASAIFQLGATSTATGTNIVEFSKRLMGLANVSRISTQDLLALGSASDAMGLMPEVSATAFNKLFTSIQRQHNLIESSLGMTKGTIKQYYDQGKTMDAIVEIFERMNAKGNLNLLGNIFKDLGSDGAKLVNVMATMADRADILRKHLEVSRNAFNEGEAVIGEYMIQNQTAAALLERASNLWAKAFTNPEGVDMVKEMAQAWYDLSKAMTQSDVMMKSLHENIQYIASAISTLITLFPVLLRFAITFGAMFGFKQAILGIGSLITAFHTLYKDIMLATGAMGTLNVVMKSNAFLLAAAAISTAITLVMDYNSAADEAAKREIERQAELKKAFAESKEAVQKSVRPLEVYKQALDNANLSEKDKMQMVKQFRNEYQDYLDYLGIEINSALDLAKAYTKVVQAMKLKKAYEERENYRTQVNGDNRMSRIENQAKVEGAARAFGLTDVDKKWLEQNQRLGTDQLYRQLVERRMGAKALQQEGEDITFLYIDDKLTNAGTRTSPRAKKRYKKVGSSELYQAIDAYIAAYRAEQRTDKEVDAMFNAEFEGLDKFNIDDFNNKIQQARWKRKGSLENEKPDKAAQKELTKAQQEEKKRLRKEMEDAEKDSTAVINAIEEFYRLQETAVEQLVADGKTTREEADKLIEYVRNRKDMMLMNARRAIAGKESNFEDLRTTMGRDLLRPDDVNSQRAMNTVQTIDVQAAAARLQKFDGTKNVYDLNSGSFTQSMLKNAAQNELNIQRRQAAVQTEIDKLLMQYHYIEQAQKDFGGKLVKLGLITEGYDKVVQQLADGTEIVANTKDVQALATKTIGMDVQKMYGVDPDDALELRNMVDALMHTVDADGNKIRESFASMFPDLDKWLQDPEKYKEAMQAFYKALLDMDSDYYQALKQNHDRDKRLFEERWERSGKGVAFSDANKDLSLMQRDRALTGQQRGTTFGEMGGFNTLSTDPEIAASMLRMEQMRQELELLREVSNDKRLIREKEMEMDEAAMAMQEQIMSKINDRISKLHDWTDPINEFAIAIGDAAGTAIRDSQSMAEQVQDALKNMVKAYGDSTIKIISELMMQRVKKRMIGKAMAKETKDVQTEETNITEQGGKERLNAESIVQTGIASITQQMGQQILATKQQQDSQETQMEGQKARGGIMAGIAEGAAKIIGSLGWWGIPLIAVITALLNGLLNMALSALFGGNSSSSTSTNSAASKVKLASGMLTYDEGNIGTYQGSDGQSYRAAAVSAPADGLVTQPIATTVQGQPALVAERGPEIVIGRRTTRAIMMNEPGLIKYLANYNKNASAGPRYRAFDEGNLDTVNGQWSARPKGALATEGTQESSMVNGQLTREDAAALTAAIGVFNKTVATMQQKGIPCYINKYGTGGLIDEVKSGLKFDAKYNGK